MVTNRLLRVAFTVRAACKHRLARLLAFNLTTAKNPPDSNQAQIRALLAVSATTRQALGQRPPPPSSPYGNQFTIPPDGGFPRIEPLTLTELIEHLDDKLLRNWFGAPYPKLLIRPFEWQGPDPPTTVQPLAEKICTSIAEIADAINLPNITVNISSPYAPSKNATGLPNAFLVYGIPNQVAQTLLDHRVWSSTKVTFEARAFGVTQPPTLLMALSGFTTLDVTIVKQAVKYLWTSDAVYQHIVAILTEYDTAYSHESALPALHAALGHFIETIRVERVDTKIAGGVLTPRFNIYSETPPSTDPNAWTAIRLYLAELQYPTAMDGQGTKERLIPCLLCHSHSHPTGLCPFPAIPGWNGPTLRHRGQSNTRARGRGHTATRFGY